MKTNLFFILIIILCSCSAHKRAIWHLKRAKSIDPSILDTALIKIDSVLLLEKDSSYVDSVAENTADSIVKVLSDSFAVSKVKQKAISKIISKSIHSMTIGGLLKNKSGKIVFQNGFIGLNVIGDTLQIKGKTSRITIKEIKKSWFEQAKDLWWLWLVLLGLILFIRRII